MRTVTVLLVLLVGSAAWPAELLVVDRGAPKACLVLPKDASDQLKAAAATVVECVQTSSGAALPVITEGEAAEPGATTIAVGATALAAAAGLPPKELDPDGFVISARGRAIVVVGPTDWGTEFGLYDFLERHVGVRWLLPGDSGTDIPARQTIAVPEGLVRDEPVFFSRRRHRLDCFSVLGLIGLGGGGGFSATKDR